MRQREAPCRNGRQFQQRDRRRRRDKLSQISGFLDWRRFEAVLGGIYGARRGELPRPPLVMFKVSLLQRWYGLSDPETEEALAVCLSFRAVAGLSPDDATPDRSNISRFRGQLAKRRIKAGWGLDLAVSPSGVRRQ